MDQALKTTTHLLSHLQVLCPVSLQNDLSQSVLPLTTLWLLGHPQPVAMVTLI